MPTYNDIQLLRGQGNTFEEIGTLLNISKQRAHVIFTGYRKTDDYLERKRHYEQHICMGYKPKKSCRYCKRTN